METLKEKVQMKNLKKYLLALAGIGLLVVLGCGTVGCSSSSEDSSAVTPPDAGGIVDGGGENLPPSTPEAGGVAGVDTDGNGVWQYIDEYIDSTYPNSEKTRAALRQYAITNQNALLDADDKELSIQHAIEAGRDRACTYYVLPFNEAIKAQRALEDEILNTEERTRAFFRYDKQLGGEIFRAVPYDQQKASCSFDPDSMAN